MMKEETLRGYRSVVNKFDHHASTERERQLIDSHLEALAEIARLDAEVQQLDAERCDFQCDHCASGEQVSLAAQHFPPDRP